MFADNDFDGSATADITGKIYSKKRKSSRVYAHTKLMKQSDVIGIPTITWTFTISTSLTVIGITRVVENKCVYLIS